MSPVAYTSPLTVMLVGAGDPARRAEEGVAEPVGGDELDLLLEAAGDPPGMGLGRGVALGHDVAAGVGRVDRHREHADLELAAVRGVRPWLVNEASADRRLMAAFRPASAALRAWSRSLSRPVTVTWWVPMPIHTAPMAKTTKATESDMTMAMPLSGPPPPGSRRRSRQQACHAFLPAMTVDRSSAGRVGSGWKWNTTFTVRRGVAMWVKASAGLTSPVSSNVDAALARHLAEQLAVDGGVGHLVGGVVGVGGEPQLVCGTALAALAGRRGHAGGGAQLPADGRQGVAEAVDRLGLDLHRPDRPGRVAMIGRKTALTIDRRAIATTAPPG